MKNDCYLTKVLLLFFAIVISPKSVVSQSIIERAVVYVDSLFNNSCVMWSSGENNCLFDKEKAVLRVYDSFFCIGINDNYITDIDTAIIQTIYEKMSINDYEMTHMSPYYFEPIDIIMLYWCNNIFSCSEGDFITCLITYKKIINDYFTSKSYALLIKFFFSENNEITKYIIDTLTE